jgi:hypothetical protein
MSITLQTKQNCIINENIWEPAKAARVDTQTLGNDLGPLKTLLIMFETTITVKTFNITL